MPLYEYKCEDCGNVTEFLSRNGKKLVVLCSRCKSHHTNRIMSSFSVKEGPTLDFKRAHDNAKKEAVMKQDLKTNYGVEKISMANNTAGKTFKDTYSDIKAQGSAVPEAMAAQKEINKKKTRKKQKEWMKGALKRTPKRRAELKARKEKAAAEKRKISIGKKES